MSVHFCDLISLLLWHHHVVVIIVAIIVCQESGLFFKMCFVMFSGFMSNKIFMLLMQIFTEWKGGETVDDRLKPDIIVDYLSKFSQAVILYLEFLVFTMKLEVLFYRTIILSVFIILATDTGVEELA